MPVAGDNLTLGNLAAATGQTTKSLGAAAGSVLSPVLVSDFSIGSVTSPTTNAAAYAFNTTLTVQANFTAIGSRFLSRIGSRAANFTYTVPSNVSLVTDGGYVRTYTNSYNPATLGSPTGCSASTTSTFSIRFADGFNTSVANYNTTLPTASFTLHSPPKPTGTPTSGNRPPQPCTAGTDPIGNACGGLCIGANYTVNGNAGTYNGVTGSLVNYYLGAVLIQTVNGASSSYTYTNLCGNTTYTGYVTNNFSCRSNNFSFTTPIYI